MAGGRSAALIVLSACAFMGAAREALGSGYALREQSGSLMGQAFAGQNAYIGDPSVIFSNPAGMSALDGTRVSGVATAIFPRNRFEDEGSAALIPLGGAEGGDAAQDAIVPALYAMNSYGDLRLGIGINAPWGLATSYDDEWIGRFAAITSRLTTVNVNPVASYRFNQYLSLGAGIQVQYIDARLTNARFLGGLGTGLQELEADDWGFGLTAGALFEPTAGTMIGLGWRSSIRHRLKGDAEITTAGGATVFEDGASAEAETPEVIGLSIHQKITDRLAMAGTIEWTNWSRFEELRVEFEGATPDQVTQENWHDSWFYALGVSYQLTDSLTLRGGVAYDETPIRDSFRTARLPDEDRFWTTAGVTYAFSDGLSVDLGYSHIFVKDSKIEESFVPAGTVSGEYKNSVDIFALQGNLRF